LNLEGELERTTSDFLCVVCKKPWYDDIQSKQEKCINPRCPIRDRTIHVLEVRSSPELLSHTAEVLRDFQREVSGWNRVSLVQLLYEERRNLILELWSRGTVRFRQILMLDELLSLICGVSGSGTETSPDEFSKMLDRFSGYFSDLTTIEDLASGRFRMAASKTVLVLRYWNVILNEIFRSYGIIPAESSDSEGIFRYADVDTQAKGPPTTGTLLDFGVYFDRMFDFLSTLKYSFEMYRLTASKHDYEPTGMELAALLGLAYSCRKPIEVWSQARLSAHLRQYTKSNKFVSSFIWKYAGGTSFSPIIPKVAGNIIFDWHTIVFYLHYLTVKNRIKSPKQTVTGSDRFTQVKDKASKIFEERVRTLLANRRYKVVPREVRVKFGAMRSRYDILAAHEGKSVLVIAEAKYRDPSPSSLNEEGLIKQEIRGDDGVLVWAIQEQERLDLMPSNAHRFSELLSLAKGLESYQKKAYVICKFRPIIQKYRQVDILSLPEFYAVDL